MNISGRRLAHLGLALCVVLSGGIFAERSLLGQGPAPAAAPAPAGVDYATQISELVLAGKFDQLSHLSIPTTSTQTTALHDWTSQYVTDLDHQQAERDKQYATAVQQAKDQLKSDHYDKSMDKLVLAYRIAKDPGAFLNLDWVQQMSGTVAGRAADLEKQGQWIESLQLYTDLNTLYEISTKYKADMQRLGRRVRLLAVYTPKKLYEMQKALAEKEKDASTQPATQPEAALPEPDDSSFTRWQDFVSGITTDMMDRAIQNSEENWVEETNYDKLIKGGVESLRLFLSTPEVAGAFPALADEKARNDFNVALDTALALDSGHQTSDDVHTIVSNLVDASSKSIKLPKEVVIMEFTEGAMEKLDPFTAVIWPHEVPEFEKNMSGEFSGVGIQISLEGGVLKVVSPLEDTPAFRAGIQSGDVISAIDGKSTVGISVDQAVSSIMGPKDTQVVLTIKREAKKDFNVPLTRATIHVSSVKGIERDASDPTRWNYMLDPVSKIGYIRITGFQQDTPEELRAAIEQLNKQGMKGLVLDLRFNPGGLLQAAVEMCDDFLQDGVIVSTRGRSARARPQAWQADSKTLIPPSMPMVVLVNEYSASASEIFSGAMKDLHRALIVGHRSFGKGSVQNLIYLPFPNSVRPDGLPEAMMKLTMAYYYLPDGENLHRRDGNKTWGVDPDVVVDLTPDQLQQLVDERRDNDIIRTSGTPTATAPSTKPVSPDTQLETAMLMMRLQLIQTQTALTGK